MIDRFDKMIADVRAIDPAQVPSDTNLMAVLKRSIEQFENLWLHLEYDEKMELERMCDIITRWRGSGSNLANSKHVANFVGKPDWKKKGNVKQANSGRNFEKSGEKRKCVRQS